MSDFGEGGWPPRTSDGFARIVLLPPYVFAQVNEEKQGRIDAGGDVIDLGMGSPDLGRPRTSSRS